MLQPTVCHEGRRTGAVRARLAPLLQGFAFALLAGCAGESRPPDVILYVIDTLRADHLEIYGYERATAPRLAALAEDSVVFEAAQAPSSWTKPSTASLLTGLAPDRHRATTEASILGVESLLLSERLAPLGYRCISITTNPWTVPFWGLVRGFEEHADLRRAPSAERVTGVALRLIEPRARQAPPLFVYLHTLDPHGPYDPPEPYDRRFEGAKFTNPKTISPATPPRIISAANAAYDGEIAYGDAEFGKLLDHLRATGRYDAALIVFTSDHGEELGDRGYAGHGRTLHREVVRVPLVVKLPGNRYRGTRVSDPVSLLDVVPTVLAQAGVSSPPGLEGVDLAAIAAGRARVEGPRALFLGLDLAHEGEHRRARGVLEWPWKYLETWSPELAQRLFHVRDDPHERVDLASREPEIAERLAALLRDRAAESRGGFELRLRNRTAPGPAERHYQGRLHTTGRFVGLRTWHMEEHDRTDLSPDQKSLRFDLQLENRSYRNAPHAEEKWYPDEDVIGFELEPPAAAVEFESFRVTLPAKPPRAGLVYRGTQPVPIAELPFPFARTDSSLWVDRSQRPVSARAGAYLSATPPAQLADLDALPPDERERLRALGYLEGAP